MDCRGIRQWLSLYLDNELGSSEQQKVEEHLQECPACMEYYRSIKLTKQYCSSLKDVDLPLGFHDRLHQKLVKEEQEKMPRKFKFKIGAGLAAALVLILIGISLSGEISLQGLNLNKRDFDMSTTDMAVPPISSGLREEAGSGSSFSKEVAVKESAQYGGDSGRDYGTDEAIVQGETDSSSSILAAQVKSTAERKIIKSAYLSVETLEFDRFINTISGKLNSLGGYIEYSNVEGTPSSAKDKPLRRANFQIWVPREYYEKFIADIEEMGNLLTKQENGRDITGQYFDTEARLKSLQIQEQRLLTILEEAEKLQDIIELEKELSRVRYEIENLTSTLTKWDNMVEYSSINLDVYEVRELKEEPQDLTLGERVVKAFTSSLKQLADLSKDLIVFIAVVIPYLVVLGGIGGIIWTLVKFSRLSPRFNKNKIKGDEKDE